MESKQHTSEQLNQKGNFKIYIFRKMETEYTKT